MITLSRGTLSGERARQGRN